MPWSRLTQDATIAPLPEVGFLDLRGLHLGLPNVSAAYGQKVGASAAAGKWRISTGHLVYSGSLRVAFEAFFV